MSKRGFRSSLQKALANIGRGNGHAPPAGGTNVDPFLHYYFVDTEAASFFTAQRKSTLQQMLEHLPPGTDDKIADLVADAKKQNRKQPTSMLYDSDRYVLNLDVKKPSERVDVTRVRNMLMKDGRYTADEIEKMFQQATNQSEPAKTFTVAIGMD